MAEHFGRSLFGSLPHWAFLICRQAKQCRYPAAQSDIDVVSEIGPLNRHKAAGPDVLQPNFINYGGEILTSELTELLESIIAGQKISKDWPKSIIVPIYKKIDRFFSENHNGTSLASIASTHFIAIMLPQLSGTRIRCMPENEPGFRDGRRCIDQMSHWRESLEHRHLFRRYKIAALFGLKTAFDSVDCFVSSAASCCWVCHRNSFRLYYQLCLLSNFVWLC